MVSFRGALALRERLELPSPPPGPPCETCTDQPCLTACPVGALGGDGYDTTACHDFLDSSAGADCLSAGCRVRRACPASKQYGRLPDQSAHHMRYFHR
jgi:epoxyqueuosine reductase QueG